MRTLICAGMVILLAACAQPSVTPNPSQSQHKVGYAQHWQMLASRTADSLASRLSKVADIESGGHLVSGQKPRSIGARSYFINAQEPDSAFSKAFTPFLQEELRKRGYSISRTPRNAVVVNYTAQTFYYGSSNSPKTPFDYATFWTTAGAIGILASDWEWTSGQAAAAVLAAGPVLDVLNAMGGATNAEVVLTTSVVGGSNKLYQASEAFYVEPENLPFYWSIFPAQQPMKTAKMGASSETVRTFKIDGASQPQPEHTVLKTYFLTYFDFDKAALKPDALKVLDQVVEDVRKNNGVRVSLVGYADRAGTKAYNLKLSMARAKSVRKALIAKGIAPKKIMLTAKGESDPAVQTPDGVPEPRNRRVKITIGF